MFLNFINIFVFYYIFHIIPSSHLLNLPSHSCFCLVVSCLGFKLFSCYFCIPSFFPPVWNTSHVESCQYSPLTAFIYICIPFMILLKQLHFCKNSRNYRNISWFSHIGYIYGICEEKGNLWKENVQSDIKGISACSIHKLCGRYSEFPLTALSWSVHIIIRKRPNFFFIGPFWNLYSWEHM